MPRQPLPGTPAARSVILCVCAQLLRDEVQETRFTAEALRATATFVRESSQALRAECWLRRQARAVDADGEPARG